MAGLNYETEKAQETIRRILAFLLGRPREGATVKEIQAMLGVSYGKAYGFVNHLVATLKIHVAVEAKATQNGHTPAYYRLGHKIDTLLVPGLKYGDIPLDFFKRRKDKMTTAEMTEYLNASQFHPPRVGPFECRMVAPFAAPGEEDITHKRWWNGEHWSYPLQPDHEDLDGHYLEPESGMFVTEDALEYQKRFEWRGFSEDPDPL